MNKHIQDMLLGINEAPEQKNDVLKMCTLLFLSFLIKLHVSLGSYLNIFVSDIFVMFAWFQKL